MKYVFIFRLVVTNQRVEVNAFIGLTFTKHVSYRRFLIGITWNIAKRTIDIFYSPEVDKLRLVHPSTVMYGFFPRASWRDFSYNINVKLLYVV